MAEVSNAIVHLDEYKWALPADKQEILKGLWNGVGRSRVNVDNGMRKETTADAFEAYAAVLESDPKALLAYLPYGML